MWDVVHALTIGIVCAVYVFGGILATTFAYEDAETKLEVAQAFAIGILWPIAAVYAVTVGLAHKRARR